MAVALNVAQISTGFIEVPGWISLNIYVQGCEKRCVGCQNPDQQSFTGGELITVDNIDSTLKMYPLCKIVCWLGGDAVYQSEAFMAFNKEFQRLGLKVCLYTGKSFEEIKHLLDDVDAVVDGEWTGIPVSSPGSNQKVWIGEYLKNCFKSVPEIKSTHRSWVQIPWSSFGKQSKIGEIQC